MASQKSSVLKNRSENYSFPKEEHLSSKKIISLLFKEGKTEFLHPFKLFYLYDKDYIYPFPQVLFSIPKRQFKKATDRNLIRRRSKEAYRLHKNLLTTHPQNIPSYLGFVYIGKEKISFQQIEKKLILLLKRFTETDNKISAS
jgi:ribonuclease P protein component